jgi:hypothetical protein
VKICHAQQSKKKQIAATKRLKGRKDKSDIETAKKSLNPSKPALSAATLIIQKACATSIIRLKEEQLKNNLLWGLIYFYVYDILGIWISPVATLKAIQSVDTA